MTPQLALVLPLVGAYALHGAKTPTSFFIAFLLSVASFAIVPAADIRFPKRLTLPAVLFFASLLLPLAAGAPLYLHIMGWFRLFSYALVGLSIAMNRDAGTPEQLIKTVLALAFIESFAILVRAPSMGTFGGYLVGNPNYSAVMVAGGLCAAPWVLTRRRQRDRWGGIVLLGFLAVGLLMTQSRSVILGLLIAQLLLFPGRKTMLALLGLGLFLVIGLFVFPETTFPLLKLDMTAPGSTFGRVSIWKTSLFAAADQWMGYGLGNFEAAYYLHQQPADNVLNYSRSTAFAHNEFLQIAVEGGVLSLAVVLWFFVVLLGRRVGRDSVSRWAWGVSVVIGIAGLFHFSTYLTANGFLFAAALGVIARRFNGRNEWRHPHVRIALLVVSAAGSLFLTLSAGADRLALKGELHQALRIMPLRADLWYRAALEKLRKESPPSTIALDSAENLIRTSLRYNSSDAFVWHRLAVVLHAKKNTAPDEISQAFARARALAPTHAPFYLQEGYIRLSQDRPDLALSLFRQAALLEPRAPAPELAIARAHERLKQRPEALEAARKALALQHKWKPALSQSEFRTPYSAALFDMPDAAR